MLFAGIKREGLPAAVDYKLYLEGCEIVEDADLLIGEMINGKNVLIASFPPGETSRSSIGTNESSKASTLSDTQESVWADNSQVDTSSHNESSGNIAIRDLFLSVKNKSAN